MERWNLEKQRQQQQQHQQQLPKARAARRRKSGGKREVDNKSGFQDMHENETRKISTKHDLGDSRRQLRFTSLLHTACLPIEMSKRPL